MLHFLSFIQFWIFTSLTLDSSNVKKIKDEKGADYFRNYPDKDNIMGYKLKSTYDALHNLPNMGSSNEDSKEAAIIHQAGGK